MGVASWSMGVVQQIVRGSADETLPKSATGLV